MIKDRLDEIHNIYTDVFGAKYRDDLEKSLRALTIIEYTKDTIDLNKRFRNKNYLFTFPIPIKHPYPNFIAHNILADGTSKPFAMIKKNDHAPEYADIHDYVINHELTHGILSFTKPAYRQIDFGTGLKRHHLNFITNKFEKTSYESNAITNLNECVTDLIAIPLTRRMHERGMYFYDKTDNPRKYATTLLSSGENFLKALPFFEKYKHIIIEAGLKKNHDLIVSEIGIETIQKAARDL